MFAAIGQTWGAMTVLDASTKMKLGPLQLRKAGAIIENMKAAEYSEEDINVVCRALFFQQRKELKEAFKLFDTRKQGKVSAHEFKKVLPLLGEDVPKEQINALFEKADRDRSGKIEFEEFCMLVKSMNPLEDEQVEEPKPTEEPRPKEDPQEESGGGLFGFLSEEPKKAVSQYGPRGAEVRAWRAVRAQKYAEIMSSGEVLPGEQHNMVQQALQERATELDAKIQEIRRLQEAKERGIDDHNETVRVCRDIVLDLLKFKDIEEILSAEKRRHALKCFNCFDFDGSGSMDLEEFTALMKLIDPGIKEAGVAMMFKDSGATADVHGGVEEMSFRHFCVWCMNTFGNDSSVQSFAEDLNELIVQVKANKTDQPNKTGDVSAPNTARSNHSEANLEHLPPDMSVSKIEWAKKLFHVFDNDGSGSLDLDEFFVLFQSIDPDVQFESIEGQFQDVGAHEGVMSETQFLFWANNMFGTSSDADFAVDMKELMLLGRAHFNGD